MPHLHGISERTFQRLVQYNERPVIGAAMLPDVYLSDSVYAAMQNRRHPGETDDELLNRTLDDAQAP